MSNKVSLMLKVDSDVKDILAECARLDRRTMSSYVETLVMTDAKIRKVTLDDLPKKNLRVKFVVVDDVTTPDLPDYLDKELWDDWCAYRSKQGKPMVLSTLKYSIREMEKAHANGWDVNELIAKALANQWTGFVFDKHRKGRAEVSSANDDVDEDKALLLQREKLCEQLSNLFVGEIITQSVYSNFIAMMRETDQLVDIPQIKWLFDQLRNIGKGVEWNDAILQRAIDTRYVLNESGRFDVLRAEERV